MALPLYLAMTKQETATHPCVQSCFLASHFSFSGTGLANLPVSLPPDSLLILDDRIPVHGHRPDQVIRELNSALEQLHPAAVLLDFERESNPEAEEMVRSIVKQVSCPVIVSELYAAPVAGPVFLSCPLPHESLENKTKQWKDREIWLEAAFCCEQLILTREGCQIVPQSPEEGRDGFCSEHLACKYRIDVGKNSAVFTVWRDCCMVKQLMEKARSLGVRACIGLYQEFGPYIKKVSG